MKVKDILITSDDGFDSFGVRILLRHLREKYRVSIAGTKTQQSGVGGKISVVHGGTWGTSRVDGAEALWVAGTPVDALEVAEGYFKKQFDLVIAGINLGENVGPSLIASGTFSAAAWSIGNEVGKRAIAMSWLVDPKHWFRDHDGNSRIKEKYFAYPGKMAYDVVELALAQDFWGVKLLNVNFPEEASGTVKFTRTVPSTKMVYGYPLLLEAGGGSFRYPPRRAEVLNRDEQYDFGATKAGYISVTPCRTCPEDEAVWERLKRGVVEL